MYELRIANVRITNCELRMYELRIANVRIANCELRMYELRIGRWRIPVNAGSGYLTRPALGCLGYQIFIRCSLEIASALRSRNDIFMPAIPPKTTPQSLPQKPGR